MMNELVRISPSYSTLFSDRGLLGLSGVRAWIIMHQKLLFFPSLMRIEKVEQVQLEEQK